MKKIISIFIASCMVISSCGTMVRTTTAPQPDVINLNLAVTETPVANKYVNLDYGLRLNIISNVSESGILKKYDASAILKPSVRVNPYIKDFVSETARTYMRTMGLDLHADVATDFIMTLTVQEFTLSFLSGVGWSANVQMNVSMVDRDGRQVYPNVTAVGRAYGSSNSKDYNSANRTINTAYTEALKDIDWDRIAFFLKKASNPALEKNKQVTGNGDTALEDCVIRWFIDSSPKGADVSVRVVSSTQEVKNTNQNYVGSTPYETTETFDIKGLTFNNSGNVQIEVTCEKAGYITQKKRFNLRQAIEQKEISTKFNLVKEE